ncbi:hypothetical protein A0H81_01851 [Grifola frondosa]|uniref:Uncharacterized protein n=1 Tax=Grifola frondosa TaxID=5627 RepID=A0A1C7MKK3_GRIFR|nr:hypothetical protein A0H81_01851 [Grifola frondosa]
MLRFTTLLSPAYKGPCYYYVEGIFIGHGHKEDIGRVTLYNLSKSEPNDSSTEIWLAAHVEREQPAAAGLPHVPSQNAFCDLFDHFRTP